MAKLTLDYGEYSLFITDKETIDKILESIPADVAWQRTSTIKKLRNTYFQLLIKVVKEVNPGYTKTELHNALKPMLLKYFEDMPHLFKNNKYSDSTKNLNREGWLALIEQLKVTVKDIFGYSLE